MAEAVHCLQQASAIDPMCAHAMLFLGRIFDVEQDQKNALMAYQQCLRIESDHVEATEAIARIEQLLAR